MRKKYSDIRTDTHRLKTTAMTIATAVILTACQSEGDDLGASPGDGAGSNADAAVTFAASTINATKQTRANDTFVDSGENLPLTKDTEHHVGIFGYYTGSSDYDNSTATANFMYNQKATVEAGTPVSQRSLTYSPLRLWPNDSGKLSFWAYYPYSATSETANSAGDNGIGISTDSIGEGMGMGSIFFQVQEQSSEQVDLLVSELEADKTKPSVVDGTPEPVQFRFHHALAQVRLYIKLNFTSNEWEYKDDTLDADGYKILKDAETTVQFANVYTEGTMTPFPGYTTTSTTEAPLWTTSGTLGTVLINNYDHSGVHINAKGELATASSSVARADRLLMIPQGITDRQAAHIITTVTQAGKTAKLTINLQGMEMQWRAGYIYSYAFTVTLAPGEDVVAGPSLITTVIDESQYTEQW